MFGVARGSTTEIDYWLYLLRDIGYIDESIYNDLSQECCEQIAMLSSMIEKIGN